LNITENCIDRHLADKGDQPAIIWEPNDPSDRTRVVTYNILHKRVCQFAQVLINNGVKKGDRVCIYMGMVPELAYAVLGCARIGAIHSVIFGGFSAQSIADRLADAKAEFIITCDGAYRGAKDIPLKSVIDDALVGNTTIKRVIVYTRTRTPVSMIKGRDVWWEEEMEHAALQLEQAGSVHVPAVAMEAEDPLFILYTSGSTGKPKGVVHSSAGYMLWTNYTFINVFQYQPGQVHFCTADIGWITGHSYILYGPLSAGATSVMFEGIPTWPDAGRFWDIVDKYKVNILYTAPTAIRSLMGFGMQPLEGKDLSSLQVLGTVGEPINEEAWHWYDEHIGKKRCPIVDTWWQTETGGIMITPLPGAIATKPGSATLPFPGIIAEVVDLEGNPTHANEGGYLVVKHPWPGMMRTVYKNPDRFRNTYWEQIAPKDGQYLYFAGDGSRRDEDGYFWVMGRVDDVMSVSGHRLGTMEIESALVSHPAVAEAAVVGRPDEIKGEEVYAFVTLEGHYEASPELAQALKDHVVKEIGIIARPGEIRFTDVLPKTRSGKIMRRLLRTLASGQEISGDTSTLEDRSVLDKLRQGA
jgi:acetyl-CoA synthetase